MKASTTHPFFDLRRWCGVLMGACLIVNVTGDERFRPQPGKFPPLDAAVSYRGELAFVDHANRRGAIRVQLNGPFRFSAPHPFAMLPYGMIRYHGAAADLRDIPLGTVLHVSAFLPPDPAVSPVPVLPLTDSPNGGRLTPRARPPAENHVLLLEDEPSFSARTGVRWRIKEVEIKGQEGLLTACRSSNEDDSGNLTSEQFTFDAATRMWRGRECLTVEDAVHEGLWASSGVASMNREPVMLGIVWKPTPGGVFNRFHVSDVWLDAASFHRATARQSESHKSFIRSRWLPGWIDSVEYGRFGRATLTATLFGGMDPSLYADFKQGGAALMNAVESTLKHTEGGTAGPTQMAARGKLIDVSPRSETAPFGSSGIQIRFETDLITEGMRPTRIIKIRPVGWPDVHLPREEYLGDGASNIDERFPSPSIFPKY